MCRLYSGLYYYDEYVCVNLIKKDYMKLKLQTLLRIQYVVGMHERPSCIKTWYTLRDDHTNLAIALGLGFDTITKAGGIDMVLENPGLLFPRKTTKQCSDIADILGVESKTWLSGLPAKKHAASEKMAGKAMDKEVRRNRCEFDKLLNKAGSSY